MKILVVEDNGTLAMRIATALKNAGMLPDIASTSRQVEQALAGTEYDAILLDLGLPDRDGLQLMQDLRSRESSIPILVTTARHALHDRVSGLRAGADDYLVKPFHQEELVARLQALLRRPGKVLGRVLRIGNVPGASVPGPGHRQLLDGSRGRLAHAPIGTAPCHPPTVLDVLKLLGHRRPPDGRP